MRKIKFYGTFGPNCCSQEVLIKMIEEGMTGIRLNLSHMGLEEAEEWMTHFERSCEKTGKKLDLAIDLEGPELRIGKLEQKIVIKEGEDIYLGSERKKEKKIISIPDCLIKKLEVGQMISVNDGMIKLSVEQVVHEKETLALCKVRTAGELSSRKSIAIEGVTMDNPVLTAKDIQNLKIAGNYPVTEVMLPFVRDEKDVLQVRQFLKQIGLDEIRILAKIEHQEGVKNIDHILEAADCIVIARGDLGNRFPIWKVPTIQKQISKKCREAERDFMVVTQMLHSMIQNPVPTRAEVLDIYNAVLDGATSLMVTGETAVGRYPVEVIKYLVKVAKEAL